MNTIEEDRVFKKTIEELIQEENLEYISRVKDKRRRIEKEKKELLQQTEQGTPLTKE
ncbi:MAG: hypothetical protein FWH26_06695 [Oscillospiraceae bacterium]|nr:hypothetical protein [Oscillospiraceae bacterium]